MRISYTTGDFIRIHVKYFFLLFYCKLRKMQLTGRWNFATKIGTNNLDLSDDATLQAFLPTEYCIDLGGCVGTTQYTP